MIATCAQAKVIVASLRVAPSADCHALTAIAHVRGTGEVRSRTVDIRNVVDRVGAGDALVAGCLASILDGSAWRDTLDQAVMAGALKHSIPGDINRCSRWEIAVALESDRPGRLLR